MLGILSSRRFGWTLWWAWVLALFAVLLALPDGAGPGWSGQHYVYFMLLISVAGAILEAWAEAGRQSHKGRRRWRRFLERFEVFGGPAAIVAYMGLPALAGRVWPYTEAVLSAVIIAALAQLALPWVLGVWLMSPDQREMNRPRVLRLTKREREAFAGLPPDAAMAEAQARRDAVKALVAATRAGR